MTVCSSDAALPFVFSKKTLENCLFYARVIRMMGANVHKHLEVKNLRTTPNVDERKHGFFFVCYIFTPLATNIN